MLRLGCLQKPKIPGFRCLALLCLAGLLALGLGPAQVVRAAGVGALPGGATRRIVRVVRPLASRNCTETPGMWADALRTSRSSNQASPRVAP